MYRKFCGTLIRQRNAAHLQLPLFSIISTLTTCHTADHESSSRYLHGAGGGGSECTFHLGRMFCFGHVFHLITFHAGVMSMVVQMLSLSTSGMSAKSNSFSGTSRLQVFTCIDVCHFQLGGPRLLF